MTQPGTSGLSLRRLILSCTIAMCFFAANSLLTKAALAEGAIGAGQFGVIRLISGAVILALLVMLKRQRLDLFHRRHMRSALALFAYMFGFSLAYQWLGAGIGALILFAGVQVTMFFGAVFTGEAVPRMRWIGMAVALSGLAILYLPGAERPHLVGAALMLVAALGWGIYSLCGRGATAPLASSAANFVWASLLMALLPWHLFDPTPSTFYGIALAVAAGAVTSGLGYAIWYSVLPYLSATRASVIQLSAPIIALAGGAVFLNEPVGIAAILAATLVVVGVLISLRAA